jgi:hypothetical protein
MAGAVDMAGTKRNICKTSGESREDIMITKMCMHGRTKLILNDLLLWDRHLVYR